MIETKLDEILWIEKYSKIKGKCFSKETIKSLHSCICDHPQVVNSPLTNELVKI